MSRKALQSVWYQINGGREIHAVGEILENNAVKGGTRLSAEFVKLCNRPPLRTRPEARLVVPPGQKELFERSFGNAK
jgi:hypothetical protein